VDIPTNKAGAATDAALHKKMLQLLSALWTSPAIGAFARLDLADAVEDDADDPGSIAQLRNLNADRVYRLLRALSTLGIVTETADHFALTPLGGLLLRLARTLPTQHPAMTVIEAVAATARCAP
jgi:hypothetical protein